MSIAKSVVVQKISGSKKVTIMAKKSKKNYSMPWPYKIAYGMLLLCAILTLAQFVFKTYFGIDLGLTFFGHEMF